MRAHPLLDFFSPLSQRWLNLIKPVYDPDRPDGWLNLTASALGFNQLGQYTSSPGHRGYCYAEFAISSLAVIITMANTHCAYPRMDGQAELVWVVGYIVRQFTCPKVVTDPSNNWAQCRATALIETNGYHYTKTPPCLYCS